MSRFFFFFLLLIIIAVPQKASSSNYKLYHHHKEQEVIKKNSQITEDHVLDKSTAAKENQLPFWLILPFLILLGMIASGPVLYAKFWHKYFAYISFFLAFLVTIYYIAILKLAYVPIGSFFEYVQFISLIASLYIASSGILIKINKKVSPIVNILLLVFGSVISNLIGTTGASMLLIKPYIRLNSGRVKVYHIIFFILMISNIGGALTPIGDPPLFLGFLKGIPFFWTLINNFSIWVITILILAFIFFIFDRNNKSNSNLKLQNGKTIIIKGKKNILWLCLIIGSVFLDPNIFDWIPSINFHGHRHSFLREIVFIIICYLSYKKANKQAMIENEFSFEPLKEVVFIFIGIFGTMSPALFFINAYAQSDIGKAFINPNSLYWSTGILSSFLDNAPTYLNFLTASMSSHGADIANIIDVKAYAQGGIFSKSILHLKAISISAVFFGAMTYVGNGPNFMVKSIAESMGVRMPSFFGYILRYTLPILLPILIVIWLLFFYL